MNNANQIAALMAAGAIQSVTSTIPDPAHPGTQRALRVEVAGLPVGARFDGWEARPVEELADLADRATEAFPGLVEALEAAGAPAIGVIRQCGWLSGGWPPNREGWAFHPDCGGARVWAREGLTRTDLRRVDLGSIGSSPRSTWVVGA